MDGASAASTLGLLFQILALDLLLSGDNALVIALACRHLPPEKARLAAWLGAAGAIFLRFVLTATTGALMSLPFLQMVSAFPLIIIALHLMVGDEEGGALGGAAKGDIFTAASLIIVSDAAMSIDNVVALAAVSGGNIALLLIGFLFSVPLIVFGSLGFGRLIAVFPWLVDAGGALLGWIAGGLVANDPAIADWVRGQAPALQVTLPLAGALFVLIHGRASRGSGAASWGATTSGEEASRAAETVASPGDAAKADWSGVALRQDLEPRQVLEPRQDLAPRQDLPPSQHAELSQTVPAPSPQPGAASARGAKDVVELRPEPQREACGPAQSRIDDVVAKTTAPDAVEAVKASGDDAVGVAALQDPPDRIESDEEAGPSSGDRIMLIGLAVMFVVFGLFLALFIAIPE